ncbi:NmrA-like family protein [Stagonosporopsis vannaccii]|nr:NmrA-like family protein [Stagonosporopsis vannaccii]
MAPTFLLVGATGNTGRGVVELLTDRLKSSPKFAHYRIIAVTRSANSSAAKALSKYPQVEIIEYLWTDITTEWLRDHEVKRVFIASHNQPLQFPEETAFHLAALQAEVEYVVRISTTASKVSPTAEAYYQRAHWAVEAVLDSPEFSRLHWTSLQPNVFADMWLGTAAELIKKVKSGGKQETLSLVAGPDTPNAIIHPYDISTVATALLLLEDTSKYNKARLVLNGPEDITGNQIVALVEKHIGAKVENVSFKDTSALDALVAQTAGSDNFIASLRRAIGTLWIGVDTVATTSPEVLELAPPEKTPADVLEMLLR